MKKLSTPIQSLKFNCGRNNLYIKRDDLIPVALGGSKVRMQNEFFKNISKNKNKVVVTAGHSSSNHCRLTAMFAKMHNIECVIISQTEHKKKTFNSQIVNLCGAKIIETKKADTKKTIDKVMSGLVEHHKNPRFIYGGGYDPEGVHGTRSCYKEITEYSKDTGTVFDYIFLASGYGTTQAGLLVEQKAQNGREQIIGISTARAKEQASEFIDNIITLYNERYREKASKGYSVQIADDYVGDGYGKYDESVKDAIKNLLREHGIALDPVYTGKAFAGMLKYIVMHDIKASNILFLHTGSTPLFFDFLQKEQL